MKKKKFIVFAAPMLVLSVWLLVSCTKSAVPEKLKIGVFTDSICAPIYVGQEKGFFKGQGIDLAVKDYQAGTYAVNDVLEGSLDAATASGFVLAMNGFKNQDLKAVGAISSADNVEVIARRDQGITKPEDLRGKRIGVSKGTINEFFLSSFLSLNNILPNQVRTVDIKFADVVSALSECKIDAGISFPPFSDAIKKTLGEKGIFWSAQGGQDFYFLVIVKDKLIETRPSAVEGLLKGLIDAEKFLKKDEKKAQAIVAQRLGIDRAWVADSWSKTHFHIGLDQALLTLMEDEGRWAMQNKLVEAKKLPNYLNFFYLDGLEKLKPDAVSVVH